MSCLKHFCFVFSLYCFLHKKISTKSCIYRFLFGSLLAGVNNKVLSLTQRAFRRRSSVRLCLAMTVAYVRSAPPPPPAHRHVAGAFISRRINNTERRSGSGSLPPSAEKDAPPRMLELRVEEERRRGAGVAPRSRC